MDLKASQLSHDDQEQQLAYLNFREGTKSHEHIHELIPIDPLITATKLQDIP
jgi:hypothetical protein